MTPADTCTCKVAQPADSATSNATTPAATPSRRGVTRYERLAKLLNSLVHPELGGPLGSALALGVVDSATEAARDVGYCWGARAAAASVLALAAGACSRLRLQ